MRTRLSLSKNEETFNLLNGYIPGFNKDRALSGIALKLKKEEQYREFTAKVQVCIANAKLEKIKIEGLRENYNKNFPSEDNKCLTTPHKLYNAVKGAISSLKKNIVKFCPRNSRAPGTYSTPTMTLSNSYLCNQTPYTPDLYPDIYPDYVKELLDALEEYQNLATEIISICLDLIEEEKMIRGDDDALEAIDEECRRDIEELAVSMKNLRLLSTEGITKEDLERRREKAKSIKEMRRLLYHNITLQEYKIRIFKDVVMRGMENDLSTEESQIWTNEADYDYVKRRVRPAIEAMSKKEDLPNQKKPRSDAERMIKAPYVACFMEWCRVKQKHYERFYTYLKAKLADSPFCMPEYKSITGALKNLKANKKKEYIADFESYS